MYLHSLSLQDGETAVFKASMGGHSSVVQELLQGGADPNIPTKVSERVVRGEHMLHGVSDFLCMCNLSCTHQ